MKLVTLPLLMLAALSACTPMTEPAATSAAAPPPVESSPVGTPLPSVQATEVRDLAALEELRGNSGLTLQWINWDRRGTVEVSQRGDVVHLKGAQVAPDGKGRIELEGDVLSIDSNDFIFQGRITITDTPDAGRKCVKDGDSEFAITQGRRYWRMREFEWCDQLTDYIDIYF